MDVVEVQAPLLQILTEMQGHKDTEVAIHLLPQPILRGMEVEAEALHQQVVILHLVQVVQGQVVML
jgi:hypothetical protein